MFNKGKIEELNTEIQRLDALVKGLSEFGALGILEVKEEILKLEENKKSLSELKQTMSFLSGNRKIQLFLIKSGERILLADEDTFKRECNSNQLLHMEFLHE